MSERYDVVVVGAGPVGLAAAVVASDAGWSTCLVGPPPRPSDGRTAALLQGSVELLAPMGVWEAVRPSAGRLARLRIVDATDSLFRPPPVEFRADEIGLEAFGYNVENSRLASALAEAASLRPIAWQPSIVDRYDPGADRIVLSDGSAVSGRLVIAADGRSSAVRREAGIGTSETRYPQTAFTTLLRHGREHGDVSTEFHTRTGPMTLVPLPGRRSSLVWVTVPNHARRLLSASEHDLAAAIDQASAGLLGQLTADGPRGSVPLVKVAAWDWIGSRLALAGEAAHVLPPLGAQGLNLGFADVAALRGELERAHGGDPGDPALLKRYRDARRRDVGIRGAAVDGLNRALLSSALPVDAARGIGLSLLARIGPLRRAVMRAGIPGQASRAEQQDRHPAGLEQP